MLVHTDILEISNVKYVMDKGFYSDSNITDMLIQKKKFTIAVPFSSVFLSSIIDRLFNHCL